MDDTNVRAHAARPHHAFDGDCALGARAYRLRRVLRHAFAKFDRHRDTGAGPIDVAADPRVQAIAETSAAAGAIASANACARSTVRTGTLGARWRGRRRVHRARQHLCAKGEGLDGNDHLRSRLAIGRRGALRVET